VAVCESEEFPWMKLVHDEETAEAVERYVMGYMAFWQIGFIEKERLVPCDDEQLREAARLKINRYIEKHPPVQRLPCFYLVLVQQTISPMEADGLSRVYQV
jgi:hypothetical protein